MRELKQVRQEIKRWAVKWRQDNELDGNREYYLCNENGYILFKTRFLARQYIADNYGFIRRRQDLQEEPHGWKMPIPVRVLVHLETIDAGE